uniref:Uncharacterized protein n=1 Tax=Acidicaldus sp. TaxID=1872105 RepID=A0A8J4HBP3_9PROT
MRFLILLLALVLLAGGSAVYWRRVHPPAVVAAVAVYGTIDIRQVSLSCNDSDRITHCLG